MSVRIGPGWEVPLKTDILHLTQTREFSPLGGNQGRQGEEGQALRLLLVLGSISLCLHGWMLGVRLGGDSQRYLEAASRLAAGLPLINKQADFLAYDWLVRVVMALGTGEVGVVVAQAVLSLAAGLLLYLGAGRAFGHQAGLVAAVAYMCWPDLQRWNFYILSDGPFNSLLAMTLGLAFLAARQAGWWLALLPTMTLMALTRPEGVFFLPCLAIYWGLSRRPAGLVMILATFGLLLGLKSPTDASTSEVLAHLGRGTVVWGYPPLHHPPSLPTAGYSLAGWLWASLTHDTWNFLAAMAQRAFWHLAHARPFYSLPHNLWAGLSNLALWVLGLWGLVARHGQGRHLALPWLLVLTQLGLVMLTWADWDGRFLARVTPAMLILAAEAILGQEEAGSQTSGVDRFQHL